MDKLWMIWCKSIDRYPFPVLIGLFIPVLVFEYTTRGIWVLPVVAFVSGLVLSIALSAALKLHYRECRGRHVDKIMDYRRPSAHTLIAATLSTTASLIDWRLLIPLSLLTLSTGYSRLCLLKHNTNEVVEGGIEGVLLGLLIYFILFLDKVYI